MENKLKKSNALVQNSYSNMSVTCNRIKSYVLYKAFVSDQKIVDFSVGELLDMMGVSKPAGSTYKVIKEAIGKDATQFFEVLPVIDEETGRIRLDCDGNPMLRHVYYFDTFFENGNGYTFQLTNTMYEMLKIKKGYTLIDINNYLKLRSNRSQKLYELLCSFKGYSGKYNKNPQMDLIVFKRLMQGKGKLLPWNKFREKYLDNAIKEINSKTELTVNYKMHKKGTKYDQIEFQISNEKLTKIDEEKKNELLIDYNGCKLSKDQIDEIIQKGYKSKIYALGRLKEEKPNMYKRYQGNGKTDYEIILDFIAHDMTKMENNHEPVHKFRLPAYRLEPQPEEEPMSEEELQELLRLQKEMSK